MKFTFTLVSDLHVDTGHSSRMRDYKLGDYVIVAGDTSNGLGDGPKFINKLKRKGHKVFAIDGNHEHYANVGQGRSVQQTEDRFFDLIEQERVDEPVPGLTVVGTNGWYDPYEDEQFWKGWMNDHRYAGHIHGKAVDEADILNDFLGTLDGKVIVVTHMAPVRETLIWKGEADPNWDRSNAFYQNVYMAEVLRENADKILVWCHGHTHRPADVIVDGVRVVCNPRGYPGENPDWQPLNITVEF